MNTSAISVTNFIGSDFIGSEVRNIYSLDNDEKFKAVMRILKGFNVGEYIAPDLPKRGYVINENENNLIEVTCFFHFDISEWFEVVCSIDLIKSKVFCSLSMESYQNIFFIDGEESNYEFEYSFDEFFNCNEMYSPSKFEILIGCMTLSFFPKSLFKKYSIDEILKFSIVFSKSYYEHDQLINIDVKNDFINDLLRFGKINSEYSSHNNKFLINSPFMELKW